MSEDRISILLIDHDETSHAFVRALLQASEHTTFDLQWVNSAEQGAQALQDGRYDVFLIDEKLEPHGGLAFIEKARAADCHAPLILLGTQSQANREQSFVDKGASDYLVKRQLSGERLEYAIRYVIRHNQTLNRLARSEARYRAVLESQHELICRFKPDTELTFVNRAYCQYFGKPAAELIGRQWLTLVPESEHDAIRKHIRSLIDGQQPVTYVHEVLASDGVIRWQQWTDQVVWNSGRDGEIELQSVGVDITERKEAEIVLQESLQRERDLNDLKSRFVTMASHQFRTPLTKIMSLASFLEMAGDQLPAEKRIVRLQKIQAACEEMSALMDEALSYGEADPTRSDFRPQPIDLIELVGQLVEELRESIAESHQLLFNHDSSRLLVEADSKLLRQALINIVRNGVDFSPAGSTLILEVAQNDKQAVINVEDSGPGIAAEEISLIFEPFYRGQNVRNISGAGLGLAIAARSIARHGGSLTVQSQEGQGSRFTITLPLKGW